MWLVRAALSNFHAVFVFMMLIVVLGSVALMGIPVDILPAFKAPAVQVLTYYNGMPARSTERASPTASSGGSTSRRACSRSSRGRCPA